MEVHNINGKNATKNIDVKFLDKLIQTRLIKPFVGDDNISEYAKQKLFECIGNFKALDELLFWESDKPHKSGTNINVGKNSGNGSSISSGGININDNSGNGINISSSNGNITINGKSYRGSNVEVRNGVVWINGEQVDSPTQDLKIIDIKVTGDVENIKCDGNATINGNVGSSVSAGGSVTCNKVNGSVSANGSITCDDVGSSVTAGGSVTCDNVNGSVSAGGSVRMN